MINRVLGVKRLLQLGLHPGVEFREVAGAVTDHPFGLCFENFGADFDRAGDKQVNVFGLLRGHDG